MITKSINFKDHSMQKARELKAHLNIENFTLIIIAALAFAYKHKDQFKQEIGEFLNG